MTAATFRPATLPEIATMLDWAADEGWNPGLDDAEPFQAADPGGFFVATVGNRPVAAISVVNHSATFAFLGLYLCRPAFRGQGIGYALWRHALTHAGARTVGLDGVAAQEANYARSGFVRAGASVRFEGILDAAPEPAIRPAAAADRAALAALDAAANGVERPAFLQAWTAPAATRRTLVLDAGGIGGFVTIRRCRDGAKIGPIVADDAGTALRLAGAALAELPARRVIIDLPPGNEALASRLGELGFKPGFATARMYRGTPPRTGIGLQAIATMELG